MCYEWRVCGARCVELCPFRSLIPFTVFAVAALLVYGGVFLSGLCHCGIAVMVRVGRKGGGAMGARCGVVCYVISCCIVGCGMAGCGAVCGLVALSSLFYSPALFLFLSSCVGVRGSARAALRARTSSPNTIVRSCCLVFSPLFLPRLSSCPAFLFLEWRWGGSPCVGALCWHDGDG